MNYRSVELPIHFKPIAISVTRYYVAYRSDDITNHNILVEVEIPGLIAPSPFCEHRREREAGKKAVAYIQKLINASVATVEIGDACMPQKPKVQNYWGRITLSQHGCLRSYLVENDMAIRDIGGDVKWHKADSAQLQRTMRDLPAQFLPTDDQWQDPPAYETEIPDLPPDFL